MIVSFIWLSSPKWEDSGWSRLCVRSVLTTCSLLNCCYVWFLRLIMRLLHVLNYSFVHLCEGLKAQFLSQQEFLQSATLHLICNNQGVPHSVIFIFFFFSSISFPSFSLFFFFLLLHCMQAEIQSGKKCKKKSTEILKSKIKLHRPQGGSAPLLLIQETFHRVNMFLSNGSQAKSAWRCAADHGEKSRLCAGQNRADVFEQLHWSTFKKMQVIHFPSVLPKELRLRKK